MKHCRQWKQWQYVILLLVLGAMLLYKPLSSGADFGDFGGDTDYGGDTGGTDWSFGGDDYYYSDSGSGGDFSWFDVVIIIVIIVIVASRASKKKSGGSKGSVNIPQAGYNQAAAYSSLKPISEYLQVDSTFSETQLKEKVANLYVQMQNCWTKKDISSLRMNFTDALFTQMDRQLQSYVTGHKTNYVEKIAVLRIDTMGWKQEAGYDHIILQVNTRITDYTLDDQTGNLLSGNPNAEKFMCYEYDLCRQTGQQTMNSTGTRTISCPHCGAPVDINVSARCEYCGSVIEDVAVDWAICGIKGLSQQTR